MDTPDQVRDNNGFLNRFYQPLDLAAEIEAAQVDLFRRGGPPPVLLINVILALVLVVLLWGSVAPQISMTWLTLVCLIALANFLLYRAYDQLRDIGGMDAHRWRDYFAWGALVNGANWGLGGALLYTPAAALPSVFVLLTVAGIASGAAAAQNTIRAGFYGFIGPALLIPAAAIPIQHGAQHLTAAGLLLFYFAFIVYIGLRNRAVVISNTKLRLEREALSTQLSVGERYFRSLIENASDLVAILSADGVIQFQSPSVESLLGYTVKELEQHSVAEFLHPDDVEVFGQKLAQVYADPSARVQGEVRWRGKDGQWIYLAGEGRQLDLDPTLVVVNSRDVTQERRIMEELRSAKVLAEEADSAKSQFLANISHEIRTPMHAILAMAEMLEETELDRVQSRYVTSFREAGRHLAYLINDLLDFSRIETGSLKLLQTAFDLRGLVQGAFELVEPEALAKGLRFRLEWPSNLANWRRGDPQRLRQIIVNLLSNAVKFTDQGEVTISILGKEDDVVEFCVSDTGIGIPAERQAVIFETFSQADATIGERFGGTGLGLAISKRLIEAMGGHLWLESKAGEGSRFYCSAHMPIAESQIVQPLEPKPESGPLPAGRVLVADDSAMNRMVIEEFLRGTPCQPVFVDNGEQAVAQVKAGGIGMVLMDLRMPIMDGQIATQAIRKWEQTEQRHATPIIALTAGAMEADKATALSAGCTDFITKPVGKQQLHALVRRHMEAAVATN